MFAKSLIETKLEEEIADALVELKSHKADSDEFGVITDRIAKLHKLKSDEGWKRPSLDMVLVCATNLAGILWITRYEREHPINTKALGFILRAR